MRKEFVYSIAALATFPIVVNANVTAENTGKITAKKDATAWQKVLKALAPGKYTFKSTTLATGQAGKKATIKITGDGLEITKEVKVNEAFAIDFTLAATADITFTVTSEKDVTADFIVDESLVELNFNFTKVAELLQIEYNKVTEVLATAEYKEKAADAQTYSKYYDRLIAIANADYAFYTKDAEGLQAIYAGDQSNITVLDLYGKIVAALADVKNKEKTHQLAILDGDDGLAGLNARYNKLKDNFNISYVTTTLTSKKEAAEKARKAYYDDNYSDNAATAKLLKDAKDAIDAYDKALEAEETVQKANEDNNTKLVDALAKVYGAADSYYEDALKQIAEQYKDARYAEIKAEVKAALAAIVGGDDYNDVNGAINDAYTKKESTAKKVDLATMISEFREKLTRVVSDYKTVKDQLAGVYETYDAEQAAADDLVKDAAGFLVGTPNYKQDVLDAVKDFLDLIEANDQFATVENLTEAAIKAKTDAIAKAKATYTAKAAIYADYKKLKDAVKAETTSLNDTKDAIDKYAKDTKKLNDETFKPTTIWAPTIDAIVDQIDALDKEVDKNDYDATAFGKNDAYTKALKAIQDATKALGTNANAATDLYAEIDGVIAAANKLRGELLDPAKDPKVDLTKLNVWSNQVTIDNAVKARTPYKAFIDDTEGSVTKDVDELESKLATAPAKTEPLNDKGNNDSNILPYLKSLNSANTKVKNGTTTMEAIKANYTTDEEKFAEQIDIQECNGIRTNIEGKAEVFEPRIAALQKRIDAGEFGVVKGATLKEEIDKITKKINDAKAVAANDKATKTELTDAYDSIKDLDTKDIATAEGHATEYAAAFKVFDDNYKALNGTKDDTSAQNTLAGLDKKIAEQQKAVVDLKLPTANETTYKNDIAGVSVTKKEGDKDVTYTRNSVADDIKKAKDAETLTGDEVTKYAGIIGELKAATAAPVAQATLMAGFEGDLAKIDLAKAKKDVLANDKNENGFYYLQLTGKYTTDYNTLKGKIEADKDLKANKYDKDIEDLKNAVEATPNQADANLKAFNAAKDAYDKVDDKNPGALQRYATAKAELEKYPSSQLEKQLATIAALKETLDELRTKAETNYKEGKASNDDATNINNKIKEIEDKVAEYTNEVNYTAQISKDNKAVYEAIAAARDDADAAYATSSVIINTYKNFQSTELKAATEKAQTELDALLTYLAGYDAAVKEIKDDSDAEYAATVSPATFDAKETYKAKYVAVKAELENLTKALSDKINEFAAVNVEASVTNYTAAINDSKANVAKFSSDDKNLADAVVNGLFNGIDGMLTAIKDVKDDVAKIKTLDKNLVTAAADGTGIYDQITTVEQTQAIAALETIYKAVDSKWLTGGDKTSFNTIKDNVDKAKAATKITDSYRKNCVSSFDNWKSSLKSLKATADQMAADDATINKTVKAIEDAQDAVAELVLDYTTYAAGSKVKADVEQIVADLEQYDKTKVTIGNAETWKTAADDIAANVTTVYGKLYDEEVKVIEGLIDKAREENLTYGGVDKANIANLVTAEENKLKEAKEKVAQNIADPKKGITKKTALENNLAGIENTLNGLIKTMTDANDTNLDPVIVENLNAQVDAQQKALNKSLDVLKTYDIPAALTDTKDDIQVAIDDLKDYITDHADEMASYQANAEAVLADIKAAIEQLTADAQAEKDKQDAQAAAALAKQLSDTWQDAAEAIEFAQDMVQYMEGQLGLYGSAKNYANKVNKLNEQLGAANDILTEANDKAAEKDKIADKLPIAEKAVADINTALNGLEANCWDIIELASFAYIDAAIEKLDAQVIADTWNTSDINNYTWTDRAALDNLRDALIQSVVDLENEADNVWYHAHDYKDDKGKVTEKGVLAILNEGAAKFATDLAALKQAVKDMSLVEDVKGHIVEGKESIDIDDFEALADIILSGTEEDAELARCDINGDDEVDVTDLIWLRYFLVHDEWPTAAAAARGTMTANDFIDMQVISTANNVTRIAVNLENETAFNHFQLNVQLPEGAKVVSQSLGERVEGANLMMAQNGNSVRFLAVSSANNVFAGNSGAVVYFDIENLNGDVTIDKAIFTDTELNRYMLTANNTTGIAQTITNALENAGQKIYSLGGKMMNGLKKGINIIRNSDGSTSKVIK